MENAKIRNPIFLLGSHKSGTSLLRSLLDDHKELFVFPRETHFFQYTGHWVNYPLRRAMPVTHDRKSLTQSFVRYIQDHNEQNDPYSDSPEFSGYDIERFLSLIKKRKTGNTKELFEIYLEALYYSLTGSHLPEGLRIVEKSVENAEYAYILDILFPDSSFIHIIRNPYATLPSIRKAKFGRKYGYLGKIVRSLYNSYYDLFKNQIALDRYLVIKYEDLVSNTQDTMKDIASFLEITFDVSLLHPTSLGKPWKSNSTSDQSFLGISRAPLSNWTKEINSLEIHLANQIAAPIFERYGYERIESTRKRFIPIRGEGLRDYIMNRIFFSLGI